MLYHLYELQHAAISPWRATAHWNRLFFREPLNPLAYTPLGRACAAACDVFESVTRRYGKPAFDIDAVSVDGVALAVEERVALSLPFCALREFRCALAGEPDAPAPRRDRPTVLVVAPLSGHYATLLRGTVAALLEQHNVYITDWRDARVVPLADGRFDLDDYIDYVMRFIRFLGPDLHVIAVCQPGPAVLAASALMAEDDDPMQPASVTLMGSPIDARESPTVPNLLATSKPLRWFEDHVIMRVPFPHPGFLRRVYPGFLQLTGFMTMNLDRHIDAHRKLFYHLVEGDGDSIAAHRRFYDEYLSVLDLSAEFYLQTIDVVFQQHALATGRMTHRGRPVRPASLRRSALMTVEGENDDISGIGQTQAAHGLCSGIPARRKCDYVQAGVGHYGVFNGARFRREIVPRISEFIRANRQLA